METILKYCADFFDVVSKYKQFFICLLEVKNEQFYKHFLGDTERATKKVQIIKKIILKYGLMKYTVLHHTSRQILQFLSVCV